MLIEVTIGARDATRRERERATETESKSERSREIVR